MVHLFFRCATEDSSNTSITDSTCIVEYGKNVDISYLQYLWDAQTLILNCMKDCQVWSAPYDGEKPDPHTFIQTLVEEDSKNIQQPILRLHHRTHSNRSSSQLTPLELEWDDSYDTGISPGSDTGSPQHDGDLGNIDRQPPAQPPKHIQEMKKNAIMLVKGSYIEDSDFQDDVMVYRLCAENDAQEADSLKKEALSTTMSESQKANDQKQLPTNGPRKNSQPNANLEKHNMKNSSLTQEAVAEQVHKSIVEMNQQADLELKLSSQEADDNTNIRLLSPENEDFISQCDDIIKELDTNSTGLVELKSLMPDAISPVEDEEDFEHFSVDTPSVESMPSPFGSKDVWSSNPARIQNVPFTGGIC
ncbi:UNVERIFIED_CONTAM: hypothetical protein K2H54_046747 [Gekko kuhli]